MAYSPKNANGQATMANSEPVVIASDQSAVPVSGTFYQATQPVSLASVPSHAVTNAGTFAVQVTSAPSTTVTATDLDIRNLTNVDVVTAELSAVDNAVLDTIDAVLDTIKTDTASVVTAVQLIDDVVLAEDAIHGSGDKGIMPLGVRDDGRTVFAGASGDYSPIATDFSGRVRTTLDDGEGNARAAYVTAANALKVDGSAVTQPVSGTVTANLGATDNQVLDDISADTGNIDTKLGTIDTDTGDIATAVQLLDDTVFADDAAVTLGTSKGNVAAGVAVATDGTDPTAVSAEGDAAALRTDMNRILLVNQTHPRFWHVSADYASAQTNTSVKAAPGVSLSLYITDIQISNGATAGNVTLLDGSGGTVLYELYPAINGGAVLSLRSPIKLTANTALCITSTTVTTHSIFVSGYIAA